MGKQWTKMPPLFDDKDLKGITNLRDLDYRNNIPTHLAPCSDDSDFSVDHDNV